MNTTLLDALNRRYATKLFDPNKKLTDDQLETLLESLRLTPTSYGLQLMKVVVVKDAKLRAELVAYSHGQKQVEDASHLLVLCSEKHVDQSHVEDYISNIANTREIPKANLNGYRDMMVNSVLNWDESKQKQWMEKQVYIALGNLMTCCALLKIDACPMEGFSNKAYDEILNLDAQNLASVLVVPVGYHSENDKNAKAPKVRRSKADFVVKI